MNKPVTAVCAAVLVITLCGEKCFSLEYNSEISDNVKNIHSYKGVSEAEIPDSYDIDPKEKSQIHPVFGKLFESNDEKKIDTFVDIDERSKRRVVRQAYQGQTSIYPNLPSGSPYRLEPYPNNNNQNPSHNPQSQQTYNNNHSQSGYPSQNNGYQPNYKPSNFTNYNNPSGPYGQNTYYQPNNGQRSNNPNGSYPYSPSNPYPTPANTYSSSSSRSPYNQPGQFQNNSYSSYPSHTNVNTPSPYPYNSNQKPQYYPGQSQLNNTRNPQVVSGNQRPVIYDDSTKRPGQNPYGSYNASSWAGNLNNTQGTPPYNNQNAQNPQYSNVYPGSPGYGSPYNGPNNRPPSNNSQFGQYPSNSYPGHSVDSATNSGYNPNIPNKPPYGNGSPYGNNPYGNSDPTKVSSGHFNPY